VRRLPRPLGASADTGDQTVNLVAAEDPFQVVDIAFLDGALGQYHGVHVINLVQGRAQHPLDQIEIESLRGDKLEVAEWLLGETPDQARDGPKVRLAHPKRPRQQQKRRLFRLRLGAGTPCRDLVPVRVHPGPMDTDVAR